MLNKSYNKLIIFLFDNNKFINQLSHKKNYINKK